MKYYGKTVDLKSDDGREMRGRRQSSLLLYILYICCSYEQQASVASLHNIELSSVVLYQLVSIAALSISMCNEYNATTK